MAKPRIAANDDGRCKTPRVGSPQSRAEELAMEATALLDRHARESLELKRKIVTQTAILVRHAA